jgi:superfamily I DNA/RNA helicase
MEGLRVMHSERR